MAFSVLDTSGRIKTATTLSGTGGDVSGPGSATDDNIATFDGVTGKLIQDSGIAIRNLAFTVPLTIPVNGDFAWINQGSASVTVNSNGGIFLRAPVSAANNLRIRKITAPSTPWTVTAGFMGSLVNLNSQSFGLVFRQSSDGKLHGFFINSSTNAGGANQASGLFAVKFTNPTTFSADYQTRGFNRAGPITWLRVADNGTNRISSFSSDGINFIQFHSVGRTDFLTADEVGWFVNDASNTYEAGVTLVSWAVT